MSLRRIIGRLVVLVGVLLAVSFLTFAMLNVLGGDPALAIVGADNADQETLNQVREELGLNDPFLVQYTDWVTGVVQGDLGRSYKTKQPVAEAIGERVPVTAEIGLLAILMALAVAVPLAVLTAYKAGTKTDKGTSAVTFGLLSIPNFLLAYWLGYIVAVRLGWLPRSGWVRLTADPLENLRTAILPALSLAIAEMAVYTRILRSDMIQTLQEDYLLMARAKGLSTKRILFMHALRPSTLSLMTVIGVQFGALIGGSIIVEQIFALPGMGNYLLNAIYERDYIVVQGVVVVIAASFVIVNFAVDIVYRLLDPRIKV
ncbi:ABC transporter permease [Acidimicrobiia bacterium EGI L10123]|uniref:ABC transporter permease n=1 Tax=Salinilacustrithrix flava TaxID=2957203 RepID=UPI003D7C2264|nr:ABC transporter permease [Acidimicrobiia bacterium EGI L10123]